MVLRKMREVAEARLPEKTTEAAISVPAHFNEWQGRAAGDAAVADLRVLRLVHEPTTAAVAVGFSEKGDKERHPPFLDIGGGTVDLTPSHCRGGRLSLPGERDPRARVRRVPCVRRRDPRHPAPPPLLNPHGRVRGLRRAVGAAVPREGLDGRDGPAVVAVRPHARAVDPPRDPLGVRSAHFPERAFPGTVWQSVFHSHFCFHVIGAAARCSA